MNQIGGLLGTASFPTTPRGCGQLIDWLAGFGPVVQVGVEGTSSYGAGLTRALQAEGLKVVEVDRDDLRSFITFPGCDRFRTHRAEC